MSREIKFRGWSKRHKSMTDISQIDFKQQLAEGHHYRNHEEDEIILMQYTGLKDKNGKEIWEGDIVRWVFDYMDMGDGNCQELKDIGEIEFSEGAFTVDGKSVIGHWTSSAEIEVIGNIHENKDLLK